MSTAVDEFIANARQVDLETVAGLCDVVVTGRTDEKKGPCPRCGGKDRFSINFKKRLWNCGHQGGAGGDGIALVAHVFDFDLRSRAGLLGACAQILGTSVPEGGERETEGERAAREGRLARLRAEAEQKAADSAADQASWREKAITRARGIYFAAVDGNQTAVADYLRLRTGFDMPSSLFSSLRYQPRHTYWHGRDDRGHAVELYTGPAMVAPFVSLDGTVTGCHETWVDLACGPKFRPDLGSDEDGARLPTKKMQGVKKGSLIPLLGEMTAGRWVGGEGIENSLAVAGAEGFRANTFYFAAGDLGNLCGPADPASAFTHPTLKKPDASGRERAVRVAGPRPKPGMAFDEAVHVPEHVTELVLLADGDSETVMTAAAIARAVARFSRERRAVLDWWPPPGTDWAGIIVRGRQAMGKAA